MVADSPRLTPPFRRTTLKSILGRDVLDTLEELVDPRWTAVLAIEQSDEARAMAVLGRGDVAEKGDRVELTTVASRPVVRGRSRRHFLTKLGLP
jgi:hypothetical protein